MKQILFTLISFLIILNLYGQETSEIDASVSDLVTIPNSPEATAFIQYGNQSVSLFTGVPDISIPIHTLQGKKLSLPISLTYSPGIKVDQIATDVGLGWNLNAGGSVVRNVAGLTDNYSVGLHLSHYSDVIVSGWDFNFKERLEFFKEYPVSEGSPHTESDGRVLEYLRLKKGVLDSEFDTQPDTYSFSINGLSGTLMIDYDHGTGYCIEHPELKVVPMLSIPQSDTHIRQLIGWTITDQFGTVYEFMEAEKTTTFQNEAVDASTAPLWMEYNSAWNITRIYTFDGKEDISFNYGLSLVDEKQPVQGATFRRDGPNDDGSTPNCSEGTTQYSTNVFYQVTKRYLNSISINGIEEFSVLRSDTEREDLRNIYSIAGFEIKNRDGNLIDSVRLRQSYFYTGSGVSELERRLKLDAVDVFGSSPTNRPQSYNFSYFSPGLPTRGSFAQDYWGYYNGADGNESLIPFNESYTDHFDDGADRTPSASHFLAGTLKSIKYPTGGLTDFSYKMPFVEQIDMERVEKIYGTWGLIGGTSPDNLLNYCDDESTEDPPLGMVETICFDGCQGVPGHYLEPGVYTVNIDIIGTNSPNAIQYASIYKSKPGDYCDLYQDQSLEFRRIGQLYTEETTVYLSGGVYKVMMINDQPGVTISMKLSKVNIEQNLVLKPVSQPRINSIRDLDENGVIAKQRYFYYDDLSQLAPNTISSSLLESNAESTGTLHMPAIFEGPYTQEVFIGEQNGFTYNQYLTCANWNRYSNNRATQTPHIITYGTVSELIMDPSSGDFNGFTVSEFHNENEALGTLPYAKTKHLNGRLISRSTYKANASGASSILLSKESKTYDVEQWDVETKGFYFVGNNVSLYQDEVIYENTDGPEIIHSYGYLATPIAGIEGVVNGMQGNIAPVLNCGMYPEGVGAIWCNPGPQELYQQYSLNFSKYWIKDVQTTISTYENGVDLLETQTYNTYDPNKEHFQLVESEVTFSIDDKRSTTFKYPHDYTSAAMNALKSQHRIAEVINTKRLHNDVNQVEKHVEYQLVNGNAQTGDYLPSKVQLVFPGQDTTSVSINAYDEHNNIRETEDKSGIVQTYLWGYEGRYLIAQITGAGYSEVEAALGGLISLDHNGDALSLAQHNSLRDALPFAQVNSYTYLPGIGINVMRDPNGKETSYEYDSFGRLEYVKEFGDQVLAYEYNTRVEPKRIIGLSGDLDFNIQEVNSTSTQTLTIANSGNDPLEITSISHEHAAFSGTWSGTIEPQESQSIAVSYNPQSGGPHSNTITIISDATSGVHTIQAVGAGATRSISLNGIGAFGSQELSSATTKQITIQNSGNSSLTVTGVSYSNNQFSGDWTGTIAAGNSQVIDVTYQPTSSGLHSGILTINSDKTDGENTFALSGTGLVRTIHLSADLAFENQDINTSTFRNLTIQNLGNDDLFVSDISHTQAEFSGNWTGTLSEGESIVVPIYFSPTSAGAKTNEITVNSDASGGENTIQATAFSATRILTLTSSLSFGDEDVDGISSTYSEKTMVAQNTGNSPVRIDEVILPTGYSCVSCSFPQNIAANNSVNFTIRFNPTLAGDHNGSAVVNSNKTSGDNSSLISGFGATRIIKLEGDLNWGNIDANASANKVLTIRNNGNRALTITDVSHSNGQFSGNISGPTVIAAGATQSITLTYSPTSGGSHNGNVSVASNKTSGINSKAESGFGITRIVSLSGSLSFGSRTVNTSTTKTFTITNSGNSTLTVNSVSAPSHYTTNWANGGTIAAGDTKTVTVTFRPTSGGSKTGNVVVTATAKTSGQEFVAVSGNGATRVISLSGDTDFGELDVDGSTSTYRNKTLKVSNNGNSTLNITGITLPADYSCISCSFPVNVSASSYKNFTIRYNPTSAGTNDGNVIVASNSTSGANSKLLEGFGATRIIKLEGDLAWGNRDAGTSSTRTLVVRNTGNRPLSITDVTHSNNQFSDSYSGTSVIAAGDTKSITLTYAPTNGGSHSGSVTVTSNKTSGIPTRGESGYGITRIVSLSGSLSFGSRTVNTNTTKTFTITNTGNRTLTVNSVTAPSHYSTNWANGGTIAAGASKTVTVTFRPTSGGSKTGNIAVTASNKTSGGKFVAVSGSGATRIISLDGDTSFGDLDVDGNSSTYRNQTLKVSNSGNSTLNVTGISLPAGYSCVSCSFPQNISASGYKNFTIRFNPTSAGNNNGTITVSSNKTSGTYTKSISGYGATRIIKLEGNLSWGNRDAGTSSNRTLTVRNTGNRSLTITGVSHSNNQFSDSYSGSTVIAAGSTKNITLTYSPTSGGSHSGNVTVASNKTSGIPSRSESGYGVTRIVSLSGGLSFGSRTINTNTTKTFTITNTGNSTLTVSSVSAPSHYSTNWPNGGTISAGSSKTVTVTFRPTSAGSKTGNIAVTANKTSGGKFVSVSGTGATRIMSLSGSTAFGDLDVDGNSSTYRNKTLKVSNTGNSTMQVTSISLPSGYSCVSCSFPSNVSAGGYKNFTIRFNPTSGGSNNGTITVNSNRTGGGHTKSITGFGVTRTISLGGTTSWGDRDVNSTSTKTLIIYNNGNRSMSVSGISHSNSKFSGSWQGTIAAGSSQSVPLTFKPTSGGSQSGTITVHSNKLSGSNTRLETGFGATRIVSLSGSLNFGNRTVNTSLNKTFTITNTGNRTLSVSSITAPSHYSVNWANGGTIAAGASKTVTATFRPTSMGSKTGNIAVTANKTGGGKFVAVSGVGISKTIRLSGNMGFGDVDVNNSISSYKDRTLTVHNDGNATMQVTGISLPSNYSCASCSFPQNISAGSSKNFTIRFNPSSGGMKSGTISVSSNKNAGTNTKSISGYGATRILTLVPNSSLNFGSVNYTNGASSRNIEIRNSGNRTLTVTSISLPPHYTASWSGGTVSAGATKWVTLIYNPSSTGTHSGTVTINTNQTTSNDKTISVTGTGTSGGSGGGPGPIRGGIEN